MEWKCKITLFHLDAMSRPRQGSNSEIEFQCFNASKEFDINNCVGYSENQSWNPYKNYNENCVINLFLRISLLTR